MIRSGRIQALMVVAVIGWTLHCGQPRSLAQETEQKRALENEQRAREQAEIAEQQARKAETEARAQAAAARREAERARSSAETRERALENEQRARAQADSLQKELQSLRNDNAKLKAALEKQKAPREQTKSPEPGSPGNVADQPRRRAGADNPQAEKTVVQGLPLPPRAAPSRQVLQVPDGGAVGNRPRNPAPASPSIGVTLLAVHLSGLPGEQEGAIQQRMRTANGDELVQMAVRLKSHEGVTTVFADGSTAAGQSFETASVGDSARATSGRQGHSRNTIGFTPIEADGGLRVKFSVQCQTQARDSDFQQQGTAFCRPGANAVFQFATDSGLWIVVVRAQRDGEMQPRGNGSQNAARNRNSGQPPAATDGPNARRPGSDRANPDRPSANRPAPGRPGAQRPDGDQPNDRRPEANRPGADRPNADRPNADRPAPDRPGAQRPGGDQPNDRRPETNRPGADRPNADRPNADRPAPGRRGAQRPDGDQPNDRGPETNRPGADRPNADRPNADRLNADRPARERPNTERPNDRGPGGGGVAGDRGF